jgi:uncharacterized protein
MYVAQRFAAFLVLATVAYASPCRGADPAPATVDQRCAELFGALQRGDFAAASTHFDSDLRRALPRERLADVLGQLKARLGDLRAWKPAGSEARNGRAVRLFNVTFERGELLGIVVVDPKSLEIAGLRFAPPPGKGTEATRPAGAVPEGK